MRDGKMGRALAHAGAHTFNVSLEGMQMTFDVLNNIARPLSYEINDTNITDDSPNLVLGCTLADGSIYQHIIINNNAIRR